MSGDVMPRVNGKPFRCSCGCNVFHTTIDPTVLVCNACGDMYSAGRSIRSEGESK